MKNGTSLRNRRSRSKGGRMMLRAALAIFGLALAFGTAAAAQAPSVVLHTVGAEKLNLKKEFIDKVEPIQVVKLKPQIT